MEQNISGDEHLNGLQLVRSTWTQSLLGGLIYKEHQNKGGLGWHTIAHYVKLVTNVFKYKCCSVNTQLNILLTLFYSLKDYTSYWNKKEKS